MAAKGLRCLLLAIFLLVPSYFIASFVLDMNRPPFLPWQELEEGTFVSSLDTALQQNLPQRRQLIQLSLDLGLVGGQQKHGGIFVNKNALMKDIDPPNYQLIAENIQAVSQFGESVWELGEGRRTYLMLLPTSGAILQQNLPRYAYADMVNQKELIEEIYNQMPEKIATVDAYTTLFSKQREYIYYRTHHNLTPLGGYYVYQTLISRMGLKPLSRSKFDIVYVDNEFYGDLYQLSPYQEVRPDSLALYHYRSGRSSREYMVSHSWGLEEQGQPQNKIYHTLYPPHFIGSASPYQVYLGGLAPVMDIQNSGAFTGKLLVFGDSTAAAYLPFLSNSFEQVTFVDLLYGPDYYAHIPTDDYSHILFAFGVESFSNSRKPTRCLYLSR